ncbi:MAG: lipid-A-disaccharide synthase [Pseudohongiella sp.]|nr:MAG: lipid-A-disaccharide synthase [Pseudohongiella sp.]
MSEAPLIGIVAGEKSGDILGAGLIRELRKKFPDAEFAGIGGPDMIALGFNSLADMDRLSVMGFVEPLGRLPELFALKKRLKEFFVERAPLVFIGIDNPDFNLRLEEELKVEGIKTAHYVSPSLWAYREKRIHKVKRAVDLMLTLFPFETAVYEQHSVAVKCVGHPLADTIGFEDKKLESRELFDLSPLDAVVTLMPGSRGGEIKRLAPVFFAAAMESLQDCPQLKFLIPYSSAASKAQISALLRENSIFSGEQFTLVDDSHAAISAADLVVLSSGTATLETLLLRRPMIVGYKLAAITFAIASRIVKIPHVALPNLLAGRQLVPEYIQHDLTVETVRDEIVRNMTGSADHEALMSEFERIHRSIRLDASAQAAQAVETLIQKAK